MDKALRAGARGFRHVSSLAQLLDQAGKKRNHLGQPNLSLKKILSWADHQHSVAGDWPNADYGPVLAAPGEKWNLIDDALRVGRRNLTGGSSLLRLLVRKRGVRDSRNLPPLSEEQILHWADLHYQRHGSRPKHTSGSIADAPGETWAAVNFALRNCNRGLTCGLSLAELLAKHRGVGVTGNPQSDARCE